MYKNSSFGVNFRGNILGESYWILFSGNQKWCQHCWSANAGGAGAKTLLFSANTVKVRLDLG